MEAVNEMKAQKPNSDKQILTCVKKECTLVPYRRDTPMH